MVEAMLQMSVFAADIGKFYAFHRGVSMGGGWQVTTRDGQSVSFCEHLAPAVMDRNGEPLVFDPILANGPMEAGAWVNRLGAPDFQHVAGVVTYAQGMLNRMNSGNVDKVLNGIQRLNPADYHYMISDPTARDQLQQLGATLPAAPELGSIRLKGTQRSDSFPFFQNLGRQHRTGAVIEVGYGQGPFTNTPFDVAGRGLTGITAARWYLARLP
jgi:hypothetical protein